MKGECAVCAVCGKSIVQDEIPRLQPVIDFITISGEKREVCNACGNMLTVVYRVYEVVR